MGKLLGKAYFHYFLHTLPLHPLVCYEGDALGDQFIIVLQISFGRYRAMSRNEFSLVINHF